MANRPADRQRTVPRDKAVTYATKDDQLLAASELLISRMRTVVGSNLKRVAPLDPSRNSSCRDDLPFVELARDTWAAIEEPIKALADTAMVKIDDVRRTYHADPRNACVSFKSRRRAR